MFNKSIGKAGLNFGTICETGAQSTRRAQFLLSKDQGWTEAAGKFPGILEKPTKIRLAVFFHVLEAMDIQTCQKVRVNTSQQVSLPRPYSG